MINIGKLKEYRIKASLIQLQLANMLEVTSKYIAFLESEDKNPSLKLLKNSKCLQNDSK